MTKPALALTVLSFACGARGEELRFEHEGSVVIERPMGSDLRTTVTFEGVSLCFDRAPIERCACELCLGALPGDERCRAMRACGSDPPPQLPVR